MTHTTHTMHPNRRALLAALAATPLAAALPWTQAPSSARPRDRVLVVVQLTGGNDGLNTVVPYRDPRYRAARPVLAHAADAVLPLDEHNALHPALGGLAELWADDQLAVVHGVGTPQPDRSHFRSMEIWHTASTSPDVPHEGWIGRLAASRAHAGRALPFARLGGRDLPLALAGAPAQIPAIPSMAELDLSSLGSPAERRALETLCTSHEGRTGLTADIASLMSSTFANARQLASVDVGASDAFGNSQIGRSLALAAWVIHADVGARVLYVTQDGYDTHSKQSKPHAALLGDLDRALTSFVQQLGEQGNGEHVATLVFSEFGRRVRENASAGTDHGAGNSALLVGSPVRRTIHGPRPDLDRDDVPVTTDFRSLYATALEWLGEDPRQALPGRHSSLPLFT